MSDPQPLIRVDDVVKHFPLNDKVFGSSGVIHAVDGVSVELYPGEVLGVVGESGCGKSTLGRTIMGIEPPTSGEVIFEDAPSRLRRPRPPRLPAGCRWSSRTPIPRSTRG